MRNLLVPLFIPACAATTTCPDCYAASRSGSRHHHIDIRKGRPAASCLRRSRRDQHIVTIVSTQLWPGWSSQLSRLANRLAGWFRPAKTLPTRTDHQSDSPRMKSGGILSRLWHGYNQSLASRPLLTKSLTSTTGFIIGDTLAQAAVGGGLESYDWKRTARFATYGALVHGPSCHYFYRWLDGMIVGTGVRQVVAKVCTDQLVFTPVGITLFYGTICTLEGRPEETMEVLQEKWLKTLLFGYTVWPAAHIVNFRFVPSELRVLYINCVQMLWNTVLCQIASSEPPTDESKAAQQQLAEGITSASAQ